jgi:hypothetical protein
MARSRNIYTSSVILTAWYLLTRRKRIYCDIKLSTTVQHTQVFMWIAWYFCPFIRIFGFSQRILVKVLYTKSHRKPNSGSRTDKCGQTDGRTDIMKVIGAFRDYANAPNKLKTKLRPTGRGYASTGCVCEYGVEFFGSLIEGWPMSTRRKATQFVRPLSRAALTCT